MHLAGNFGSKAGMRKCAFCKMWYDPTNQYIRPKNKSYWEYDNNAECKCLRTHAMRKGYQYCHYFESKME